MNLVVYQPPPPPEVVDDEFEWEVEAILAHKDVQVKTQKEQGENACVQASVPGQVVGL